MEASIRPRKASTTESISEVELRIVDEKNVGWKLWKKRRYVVGLLAFFGFFTSFILRASLSIAIVAMTTSSGTTKAEFEWDSKTRGLILGGFFYGYICTQFIGGWLSARIGGKRVFGIGIGGTAFLSLLCPLFVRIDVYLFIVLRVVQGIFEGVTIPCMSSIWANWAPPLERSKLGILGLSGYSIATILSMPMSAFISERFGWPKVFYIYGIFGICWFILWWHFVTDRPDDDPRISPSELAYIKQSLGDNTQSEKIIHPWKKMITSLPAWAIVVAHFSENWGIHTMTNQLPMYMVDVLDFEIEKTGLLSGLPYLSATFSFLFSGFLADYLRQKNYLTTTQVRKIFTCGGFMGQAIFMILAGFVSSSYGIVACITTSVTIGCFASAGFFVNYLDIAPQHASVLMGMGHTIATIPGIVSPNLSGFIVKNKTASEWRIVFMIVGIIYLIGAIVYGIFASGEKQKWADNLDKQKKVST